MKTNQAMQVLRGSQPMDVVATTTSTPFPGNPADELTCLIRSLNGLGLSEYLSRLMGNSGKKSFLIFRNNRYLNIDTEKIGYFFIKFNTPMIMCMDKQEYFINYSLDHVHTLLPQEQFFRINRQFLINFNIVRDVEHYFARKLLVNPVTPFKEKLVVSKEKVSEFLRWLDNR